MIFILFDCKNFELQDKEEKLLLFYNAFMKNEREKLEFRILNYFLNFFFMQGLIIDIGLAIFFYFFTRP